jgi:hypothetical protein
LLREKPSSLFKLSGWSSISISFLMIRSMWPTFVSRILVSWNWICEPGLCWPRPRLICQDDTAWCVGAAPWSLSQSNTLFDQCWPYHIRRGCHRRQLFSSQGHPSRSGFLTGAPTSLAPGGGNYHLWILTFVSLAAGSLPPRFLLASGTCLPSLVRTYIYAVFSHPGYFRQIW